MRNLMILAKWLAGRVDVDVEEFKGSTACIGIKNGRRVIRIPQDWSYSNDPQAAELLEGVIDHEALGHGRFTDLNARSKAEEGGLIQFTAMPAAIQNILEDVYIENAAIKTYPGVQANLQRTVEILVSREFFGSATSFETAEPAQLLPGALLNILRARFVPGQADALDANVKALESVLPQKLGQLWIDVLEIASEVEHSKSTDDNIDLTIRIMSVLDAAAAQEPQQSEHDQDMDKGQSGDDEDQDSAQAEEGQSQDGSENEDAGNGDETEGGEGGDQASQSSSGKSEPMQDDASQSESAQSGSGSKPSKQPYSEQEVQSAKDILEAAEEDMMTTEIGDAISEAISQMAMPSPIEHMTETDSRTKVSDISLRVCSQVKSISDELQDALVAETRCEKSTKLCGKSLNNRVLSRVKLGNARVFRQKREGIGLSTAVSVLLDMSGSMTDSMSDGVSRLDGAVGLSYGLADVLDEFDVPFEINAYSDVYSTLKSFSQDWTMVRKHKEQPYMSGGTYTGTAMQKALAELVMRQEERRLLIVVTDGDASDLDVLISCYSEAQLMGVEIASVMIGPKIRSIEALASTFGFKASSLNQCSGLGRYAVDRVLETI